MRWVTFHYNMIWSHISDFEVHPDKQSALTYFNANCNQYFEINTGFKAKDLPATYGYVHRKYMGVSARAFKKMFKISVDDYIEHLREVQDDARQNGQ